MAEELESRRVISMQIQVSGYRAYTCIKIMLKVEKLKKKKPVNCVKRC